MVTAVRDSLNRAADRTKTLASRKVRENYRLNLEQVDRLMRVERATRDFLRSAVKATGRNLPLIQFMERSVTLAQARRRRKDRTLSMVRVQVKRKGGAKVLRSAFVARMPTGHVGIFLRKGKARLPIRELFTNDLPGILGTEEMEKFIRTSALNFFEIAMDQNIRRFTGARRG